MAVATARGPLSLPKASPIDGGNQGERLVMEYALYAIGVSRQEKRGNPMNRARKAGLALVFAGLLSTVGCCYHAQQFGSERDIGVGETGCATCKSGCCPAKSSCQIAQPGQEEGCAITSGCCPATPSCAACATPEDGGRNKLPLAPVAAPATTTVAAPPPASRASVQGPIYVVQPEKASSGLMVNPTMLLSPVPELPPAH